MILFPWNKRFGYYMGNLTRESPKASKQSLHLKALPTVMYQEKSETQYLLSCDANTPSREQEHQSVSFYPR